MTVLMADQLLFCNNKGHERPSRQNSTKLTPL